MAGVDSVREFADWCAAHWESGYTRRDVPAPGYLMYLRGENGLATRPMRYAVDKAAQFYIYDWNYDRVRDELRAEYIRMASDKPSARGAP